MVTRDSSFALIPITALQGNLAWDGFFLEEGTCALRDEAGRAAVVPLTCWHDDDLMVRLSLDDEGRIGAELARYLQKHEARAR